MTAPRPPAAPTPRSSPTGPAPAGPEAGGTAHRTRDGAGHRPVSAPGDQPPAADVPFRRRAHHGLRLDADLHVAVRGAAGLAAAMARAAARDLADLGITAHVHPDPDWFDAYVETVRAAGALARTRIHCGLELALLGADGRTDLSPSIHTRLSRVDYVVLVPAAAADWHGDSGRPGPEQRAEAITLAALRAAADLPVPVVLAAPFPDEAGAETIHALGWACARAGVAVEVTERRRTPSVLVATQLAGAGATLVAGSAARTAAGIGRWDHVRAVAAALAPLPHLS